MKHFEVKVINADHLMVPDWDDRFEPRFIAEFNQVVCVHEYDDQDNPLEDLYLLMKQFVEDFDKKSHEMVLQMVEYHRTFANLISEGNVSNKELLDRIAQSTDYITDSIDENSDYFIDLARTIAKQKGVIFDDENIDDSSNLD